MLGKCKKCKFSEGKTKGKSFKKQQKNQFDNYYKCYEEAVELLVVGFFAVMNSGLTLCLKSQLKFFSGQ